MIRLKFEYSHRSVCAWNQMLSGPGFSSLLIVEQGSCGSFWRIRYSFTKAKSVGSPCFYSDDASN